MPVPLMLFVAIIAFFGQARAGDGPWTLNPGELNVYVGADYFRYDKYDDGAGEITDLGSALTAARVTGVVSLGLLQGLEVELLVPFESVRANDPEGDFCVDGPRQDWCEPTVGLGDVAAQIKGRVWDELYRAPMTVSLSAGFRSGEAYAGRRGRLTTLGDGQTDVGAGLSVGRSSSLPKVGWYRAGLNSWYWFRFGSGAGGAAQRPGDEVSLAVDAAFSFGKPWAIGPAAYAFARTSGTDIVMADLGDIDALSNLKAAQIKLGIKLGIFGVRGRTVSIAVLRTVYARNNPSDTLSISVGIGWFIRPDLSREQY